MKISDFDVIASGDDDLLKGKNKPKPDIYQLCAKLLGIAAKDCIVFEDTNAGVVAAADAGMPVIATPNRFTKHHDFKRALAEKSFKELSYTDFLKHPISFTPQLAKVGLFAVAGLVCYKLLQDHTPNQNSLGL